MIGPPVVHDEQPRKPRSQRVDAQRNRAHLLDAAAAVLRANPDAGVEEIARRAAVGIGTLYRHFPTRDALVWAAYSEEVDTLAAAADRLLLDLPPDKALGEWMQRLVDFITAKRGLVAALRAVLDVGAPRFDDAQAAVRDAAGRLLEAGVAARTIRDDLTPTDLLRAVSGLCLDTESPAGIARSRTLVAIFFEGLKQPVA